VRLTAEQARTVAANTGLVGRHIARMRAAGVDGHQLDDAYQDGMLGLIRAVQKWDPERGRLSTYADRWIRKFIAAGREQREPDQRIRSIDEVYYPDRGKTQGGDGLSLHESLADRSPDADPADVAVAAAMQDHLLDIVRSTSRAHHMHGDLAIAAHIVAATPLNGADIAESLGMHPSPYSKRRRRLADRLAEAAA
jgi:RNA polymerase sigma factor (sigma-70 family)